jgi:ribonucleases P/MRP protein subunit RPP40
MSFMIDRRQRVVMGDTIPVWMEVFSGVPQGSVIGPFLFVVFINDLSRRIKNKLKIYADDTKIFSMMRNTDDQKTLQMDLDEALKWSKEWLLEFQYWQMFDYALRNQQ